MRMIVGRLISHHLKTKIRFCGTIKSNSKSRNDLSSSSSSSFSVLNLHNHSRPFSSSSAAATLPRFSPEDEAWFREELNRPPAFLYSVPVTVDGADTDEKIIGFAQFAVLQRNLREANSVLKIASLFCGKGEPSVCAGSEGYKVPVAGQLYNITLEAADSTGQSKIYFAAVHSRLWENLARLTDWKVVDESFKYPHKERSYYHLKILQERALDAARKERPIEIS